MPDALAVNHYPGRWKCLKDLVETAHVINMDVGYEHIVNTIHIPLF